MHKHIVFFLSLLGVSVFGITDAQTSAIPPPSNLVATTLTTSMIRLTWNDNSTNETGFYLERSLSSGGNFSVIATLSANATSYMNTGLATNTYYYYRIRAFATSIGDSYYSSIANANTIIPSAPTSFTATAVSSTQINLAWTDNSTSEIGFEIMRSSTSGGSYTIIATTAANATSYSNTGLTANTSYFYQIRASNSGLYSNTVSASATTMATTTTPPSAPTSLTATPASTSQINLTWTDNSTNETGFQIERSLTSGSGFTLVATIGANTTSYSNSGLAASTKYYYRVRATNAGGNSTFSSEANATTSALSNSPSAPTSLTATAISAEQINLSWTDNSTNESGFQIERSLSSGSGFTLITTTGANVTSYANTGRAANTMYYYRVRATNASGNSAYTSEASATTPTLPPPAAPGQPHLQIASPFSIIVSWLDNSNDENYFRVWRQQANGGSWSSVGSTQPNVYNFICDGLTPNTAYNFRVSAGNSAGETFSPVSITVSTPQFIPNYNWIKKTVVLEKNITTNTQVENLVIANGEKSITWNYFDGLGRPMQTIRVASSPSGGDLVQPIVYDNHGRQSIKYLPYESNESTGWFKPTPVGTSANDYASSPQAKFYQPGGLVAKDAYPYARTIYEPSPLNRVIERGAQGSAWQPDGVHTYASTDRTVKTGYVTNGANEVLLWTYTKPTTTYTLGLVNASSGATPIYYGANELYKTMTKDEAYNEVIQYKDKQGRVVLKKVQAPGEWSETYYVYDNFDNLVTVIPPEAVKAIRKTPTSEYFNQTDEVKNNFLKRWAFRYVYDKRKRMAIKQLPGVDPIYLVYDSKDRLILSQDGNLRTANRWAFTKYDVLNRPILTGVKDTAIALSQKAMQGVVDTYYSASAMAAKPWRKSFEIYKGTGTNTVHGYSNAAYPTVTTTATLDVNRYLTVTYYDHYNFRSLLIGNYAYENDNLTETPISGYVYSQPASENTRVVGQITGTKIKVLNGGIAGGNHWLNTVNYYDEKYRVIQVKTDDFKYGITRISSLYDFAGKLLKTKNTHIQGSVTWKDLVGITRVDHKLTKIGTSSSWDAGAVSTEQIPAGTSGWLEFTAAENLSTRVIGLSDQNTDNGIASIDYGIHLSVNSVSIFENGSSKGAVSTPYNTGDLFRIERAGGVVRYYQNNQLLYTSLIPSSSLLMADVSLSSPSATILGVRISASPISRFITRTFEYDHAGRRTRIWHQITDGAVTGSKILLAKNDYNELGQLIDKKLHSTIADASDHKQSVDYRYNIRGWLTSINNAALTSDAGITNDDGTDFFGENLSYNATDNDIGNGQLFNGNISGIKWSNYGDGRVKQKAYTYSYDAMNRLTGSIFKQRTTTWYPFTNSGLAETGITYDLNGNIKTLTRNDKRGGGVMDILSYDYGTGTTQSNQLLSVTDGGDDFTGFIDDLASDLNDYKYDANGNLTHDLNKGIGTALTDGTNKITYNYLNLPETVTKSGNSIRYIYDALGKKICQVVNYGGQVKQTDYAGEYVYENDALQFINHEEGRIVASTTKLVYLSTAEVTTGFTALNTSLTSVTQNGVEKYVKAVATGTAAGSGVSSIGGSILVQPGERYRIRFKGYRDKGSAASSTAAYLQVKVNGSVIGSPGAAIPSSWQTESWVEQVITVPGGSANMQLQAGVVWSTAVLLNEVIYINDVEITRLQATSNEYQYYLKDHLGNVRLTFTTKPSTTDTYTAGFENANQTAEASRFHTYPSGAQINTQATNATTGSNSHLLNGGYNGQVGLAKSFSVMPGDVVSIQAYVKYTTPSGTATNYNYFIPSLLSAFGLSAPAVGETGTAPAGVNTFGNWELGTDGNQNEDDPLKLFVTIVLFDKDYNFIDAAYDAPANSGDLLSKGYTVREPGYAYLFISNEHPTQVNAYFDDVSISHTPGAIVQMDDYYPFGLTYNSVRRENSLYNDFSTFQSQENIDDLGLNWDSFKWRNYQPEIGRFFNIDPLSERYYYNSPYAFSENDPVSSIELEGLERFILKNYSPMQSDQIRDIVRQLEKLKLYRSFQENGKIFELRDRIHQILEYGGTHGFVDDNCNPSDYMIRKLIEAGIPLPSLVQDNCQTTVGEVVEITNTIYDHDEIFEVYGVKKDEKGNLSAPELIIKINFSQERRDNAKLHIIEIFDWILEKILPEGLSPAKELVPEAEKEPSAGSEPVDDPTPPDPPFPVITTSL